MQMSNGCKGQNSYSIHSGMDGDDLITQCWGERPTYSEHSKAIIPVLNEKNSRLLHASKAGCSIFIFWRKDNLHETTLPMRPVFYSARHVVSSLYLNIIYANF